MIKEMLQSWDTQYPGRIESIFRAMTDVVPSHLLDDNLFDFAALRTKASAELAVVNLP
jgi:tRNA 2-thiocytidine biosynthesis protein TtcA